MSNEENTYKPKSFFQTFFVIGVGKSLLIWFLAISFIPLATVSFINYLSSYLGLTIIAEKSLITTSQLRIEYIDNYFENIGSFLELEANQKSYHKALNDGVSNFNNENVRQIGLKLEKEKLLDLVLIDKNGKIVFSASNKTLVGKDKNTEELLQRICDFKKFGRDIRFSDFKADPQNAGNVYGYMAKAIYNDDEDFQGYVAVAFNNAELNRILVSNADMGETGESYIIGKDMYFRSSSRFAGDEIALNKKANNIKANDWLNYINHQEDDQYLSLNELDDEKITTYANNQGQFVLGIYRNLFYLQKLGVNWALMEEIEHDEAFAYAKQLSDIAKIAFIVTVVIVFFISIFVTRWFVNPIKKLSSWTKQVEIGELVNKQIKAPKNEVGEMVDTFNSLVHTLQHYADVSQSAAYGDYTRSVQVRSKNDVLGNSMNQMVQSFREVVKQSNQIAKGDYSATVKPRGEKDTLGISLYEMTTKLRDTSKEIQDQDWLKTGISDIKEILSGQDDLKKLNKDVLNFLVKYLHAHTGLLYLSDGQHLKLNSSYAVKKSKKLIDLEIGEGLIGQAASDGNTIILNDNLDMLPSINYATAEKPAKQYVISPFIFEGHVLGVIALGSLETFSELQLSLFENSLDSIAIAINAAQARKKVDDLLKQTQEQANELTVQQEELRQTNEELEEQTKALRLSEESLKNQQEELKVTNEELSERTKDLEIQRDNIRKKNEELSLAQKEIEQKAKDLQKASRYKSEFMANMSHELRTPLNSILVLSQLMSENKKKTLSDKEVEFAKTINSSGSDLLDLINEILDLSKVESGKLELFIEDFYFTDLTQFVDRTFSPLTNKKKLKLLTEIEEGVPQSIKTDIQRVYQIIKNLVSNAVKFTEKGNITMSVSKVAKSVDLSKSGLEHDNAIAIAVKDTGIGIPQDKLDLIFEAFKQVDGTTSRKYGGTGLGLTISRSFSELLGGEIQLESSEKGTIFTLILPLSIQNEESEEAVQEVPVVKPKKAAKETKEKEVKEVKKEDLKEVSFKDDKSIIEKDDKFILVIEDDENFCQVLYDLAHEKGFKCIVALDGETGLHYADYYTPSAIILDIGLPGIDGYEVMERLKENTKTRHIPVHFISAADKSVEAMKMGAIGYLTKPVSQVKLEEAFKKIENIISKPIKKVLVVEDDKVMQKSIINLLAAQNVKTFAVESGEEAYDLLLKEQFDCQILDLGLKDMSGFDLLEKVRKNKEIVDLPIIIYTGKELSKEEESKLNKYADSIIIKGARSFERLLSETTLFLHQVENELPENKRAMLKKIHDKEAVLKNKKVLLVDDDMRNVFALTSLLEDKGINVIVGKNGREGIEQLKKNANIDLILMDIMMPEMDGYEATREIRKMEKYKKLPIIALTAKAMKEDREKCIAAGASDYLSKPVDTEKLLSLLRVWLYSK